MRRRPLWIVGALVAFGSIWLSGVAGDRDGRAAAHRPAQSSIRPLPPPRVGSFGGGAWCWFQDPRAVSVEGRDGQTVAGWIARNGNLMVGSVSASGRVRTHVVGHWIHDDHASPVLLVEPAGRLTVFWSGHNGHTMNYRTTLRPADISAWGPVEHVVSRLRGSLGFTYPNPVLLPGESNRVYLFWRGPDWGTDYAIRGASGRWSRVSELVSSPGQRPYVKVAGDGRDQIALAFTDAHPGDTNTNVYYAVYRHGRLWTAAGRPIARIDAGPIAPSQAQLVYDGRATGVPSWVWDVALDRGQRPVIVYATFPTVGNHAYWYARWNGVRWASHFLTFAGPTISPGTIESYYSGGVTLDHADPSILYLSRKVGRWFRIERWWTSDGGYSWRHQVVVRTGADAVRPLVPRGSADGPLTLLWMSGHYGRYIDFGTSIDFRTT
jgi:hypothetical protein